MDIFIIKTEDAKKVDINLLKEFQKKEISVQSKLETHCFSYLMVDRILREVYKIKNREILFANGKPKLKNGEKHFSISHSGKYIAICFSNHNCGIDIEKVNNKRDWRAIAERMDFKSQSEEEFYKDWTKYEAEYKLGNKGINIYQTKFDNCYISAVSENPEELFDLYLDIKKGV